jgi:hypothetical protein
MLKKSVEVIMTDTHTTKPNRKELIEMLLEMNKNIENLPIHVMTSPVMHYDLSALLILLSAIFNAED